MVMAWPQPRQSRPRRGLQPTALLGVAMPPSRPVQRIDEPVVGVGARTGVPHFVMGEVPGAPPEHVTVTPSGQPGPSPVPDAMGVTPYATGGELLIGGGYDPNDSNVQNALRNSGGNYQSVQQNVAPTYTSAGSYGGVTAPPPMGPTQQQFNATGQGLAATGNYLNTQAGVFNSQQQGVQASRAANQAQGQVYQTKAANVFPATAGVIAANAGVIGAEEAQNQGTRGVIGMQQADTQRQIGQEQGIQQAAANVGDITAVGQEEQYLAGENQRRAEAGLPALTRVTAPQGVAGGSNLAPGVVAAPRTTAGYLTEAASNADKLAGLQLDVAKEAVALQATDVSAARNAAARAGLSLDQANLLVSQAQNNASIADVTARNAALNTDEAQIASGRAGLDVKRADLQSEIAKQPPSAGMVHSPVPGDDRWVPAAQADQLKYDYERKFNASQPGTKLYYDQATGQPVGYLTPNEIAVRSEQNRQELTQQTASTQYSQSGLGGLSDAEIARLVQIGPPNGISQGMAFQEFMIRYRDQTTAAFKLQEALAASGPQSSSAGHG